MDFSPVARRRRATTSCEVMPDGLSTIRSPFTLSTIVPCWEGRMLGRLGLPGVEDFNTKPGEVLYIACYKCEIVLKRCCRNYAIDDCEDCAMMFCGCGQTTPVFGNRFCDWQNTASEP